MKKLKEVKVLAIASVFFFAAGIATSFGGIFLVAKGAQKRENARQSMAQQLQSVLTAENQTAYANSEISTEEFEQNTQSIESGNAQFYVSQISQNDELSGYQFLVDEFEEGGQTLTKGIVCGAFGVAGLTTAGIVNGTKDVVEVIRDQDEKFCEEDERVFGA